MSSSPSTVPYLPVEIIDEILRNTRLGRGDFKRCCLVNKTWLEPARKSLYYHVEICIDEICPRPDDDSFFPPDPKQGSHYLDLKSSQLIATLQSRPNLGQLVSHIQFGLFDRSFPTRPAVWMQPRDVVATFAQLCPRPKILNIEYVSAFFDSCLEAACTCWSGVEQIDLGYGGVDEWTRLRNVPDLKSVSFDEVNLFSPTSDDVDSDFPDTITALHLPGCGLDVFKAFQLAKAQFLRELEVPVKFVLVLRATHFPELARLTLCGNMRSKADAPIDFLEDLSKSTSLKVFELEDHAYKYLTRPRPAASPSYSPTPPSRSSSDLGQYLPSSCPRVNFAFPGSFEVVLSVIQESRSGHRVEEIGVYRFEGDDDNERSQMVLLAVRTLLEAYHVKLIWRR